MINETNEITCVNNTNSDSEVVVEESTVDVSGLIKEIGEYTTEIYARNNHTSEEISTLIQTLSSKIEDKFDVQLMGSLIAQLVQLSINNDKELNSLIKTKAAILAKNTITRHISASEIEADNYIPPMTDAIKSMDMKEKLRLIKSFTNNIEYKEDDK